jgi:hypothetical protein
MARAMKKKLGKVQMNVVLPPELVARIEKLAAREDRKISAQVERMLRQALESGDVAKVPATA